MIFNYSSNGLYLIHSVLSWTNDSSNSSDTVHISLIYFPVNSVNMEKVSYSIYAISLEPMVTIA